MPKLSVIILSYAIDEEVYQMNCQAIGSLFESEEWSQMGEGVNGLRDERTELEVLLMESNREAKYSYDKRVKVMMPEEKFGFHRFFNIGLDNTCGEFIAFCNNDIVFMPGWWSAIMEVKRKHPKFMCFSPYDDKYPMMVKEAEKGKEYTIGWENQQHYAPWCFVWERKVFKTISRFDEVFDFYSADGDELLTLRKYAIPNVFVPKSVVKHISKVVTHKVDAKHSPVITEDMREKYPLTDEEIRCNLTWLWDDVRLYDAYQREKAKYGHWRMVRKVNHLFDRYPWLHIRPISLLLYNRKVNVLLTKIYRMKW